MNLIHSFVFFFPSSELFSLGSCFFFSCFCLKEFRMLWNTSWCNLMKSRIHHSNTLRKCIHRIRDGSHSRAKLRPKRVCQIRYLPIVLHPHFERLLPRRTAYSCLGSKTAASFIDNGPRGETRILFHMFLYKLN